MEEMNRIFEKQYIFCRKNVKIIIYYETRTQRMKGIDFYEHLEQLKNPRKFKPWMITITKNEALKMPQALSLPSRHIPLAN